ncbi:MAG: GNAT family protein [Chloroflexota bacterium]
MTHPTDSPSERPAAPAPALPELRTPRLLLRPPTLDDADSYFEMINDPELNRFGSGRTVSREMATQTVRQIVARQGERRLELVVTLDGPVIGRVMLVVDPPNRSASVGYGLLPAYWGRGLATEATTATVAYVFERLSLDRVWARADPRNVASLRVLEKVGMQREGLLRKEVLRRGERVDRVYYGLLREEWAALRSVDPVT